MSYFARGLKDLLRTTKLNSEFFESLDDFQIEFIELCFKQNYDSNIGLMTDAEIHNHEIFREFKMNKMIEKYGLEEGWKKVS